MQGFHVFTTGGKGKGLKGVNEVQCSVRAKILMKGGGTGRMADWSLRCGEAVRTLNACFDLSHAAALLRATDVTSRSLASFWRAFAALRHFSSSTEGRQLLSGVASGALGLACFRLSWHPHWAAVQTEKTVASVVFMMGMRKASALDCVG